MRTPGHDEELALGFLHGEGLIPGAAPPPAVGPTDDFAANVVEVAGPLLRDPGARRFYTTSSCGVCGRVALADLALAAPSRSRPVVPRGLLAGAAGAARASTRSRHRRPARRRPVRAATSGCSCAKMSAATTRWTSPSAAPLDRLLPRHHHILCLSGRRVRARAEGGRGGRADSRGVGAPSSLAIELAADRGMALCGFARGRAGHLRGPGAGRRGESFIVTRRGVPVAELKPIARRRQFVNTAVLMESLSKLPPIDYERFRADVDAFVDQDPTPRG